MKFIIKRKTLIAMLFIGLSMLGYFSYKNLSVELFPNATYPQLFVFIASPMETDPRYIESQALIPVESAVSSLEGIEEIESSADQNSAEITISYKQNVDIKIAYLKLNEKINEIKGTLPANFQVMVFKFDLSDLSSILMNIEVRGSGGVDRIRNVVDKEIKEKFENIDGIANVDINGGREKTLEVILNKERLEALGLSPSDISSKISAANKSRVYAGSLHSDNQRMFVNISSQYESVQDLENLIIKDDGRVRLRDVAEVFFGVKEQTTYSRVNGKESITILLTRDNQANMIELSHRVQDVINDLNEKLAPKDIEIVIQQNMAEIMESNINQIIRLAFVGGLLAIFLLWIFLKNIRLVIAIGLAIPISVYSAFNFFYAYGISINALTLIGMALAIGMLLDNAVVVMENIYRLASKKVDTDTAAVQGTKEVSRSIIAATLTTITVFLPFVFADNFFVKLLGHHIGVSIISTLLISLLLALLLIPMLTHIFLKMGGKSNNIVFQKVSIHDRLIQIYILLLKFGLRKPAKTIIATLIVFFLAVIINLTISVTTLSEAETEEFEFYVTMPSGATLEKTDQIVRKIEQKLQGIEETKDLVSQVYEDEAVITIRLKKDFKAIDNRDIPAIKSDIQDKTSELSNAEIGFTPPAKSQRFSGRGNGGGDDRFMAFMGIGSEEGTILVKGQNYEQMRNLARDIEYNLELLSSVKSAGVNIPSNRPEVHMEFDKQIMSRFGITANTVLTELNSFQSEFSTNVSFRQNDEEYDIIIKVPQSEAKDKDKNLNDLKNLMVRGNSQAQYKVENVSKTYLADGMSKIRRVNQDKQIEVNYTFLPEIYDSKDLSDQAKEEVQMMLNELNVQGGMAVELVEEDDELEDFKFLILAAFILIYMILASVFESFSTPVVLMFSIPLAALGSLILLMFTGNTILNPNALVGFLILLGVVVNNGIILIDYTRLLRKRGFRKERAIITAGLARVRPILITAITTIIALVPMAMGKAEYVGIIGGAFAITVIGGLALSTLLTLVFVPTFYSGMENGLKWFRSLDWKILTLDGILFIAACVFIYLETNNLLYQLILLTATVIIIPAATYFVLNSLKKANETLIDPNENISIKIQNLVKIYGRGSRFSREWQNGIKIRERLGLEKSFTSWKDFDALIWQLPLLAFFVYFIYFHLENDFYFVILPVILHVYIIQIWKPVRKYYAYLRSLKKRRFVSFINKSLYALFFWTFPLLNAVLAYGRGIEYGWLIVIDVFWYLSLLISVTSNKLHREKVNVNRLTGRMKWIRKVFYRFVLIIPVIGKKKTPFKALKGVSLEIHNGMFGLLGPNGAGKTTMMRIICGILDQSYGKVFINGFDTNEKREELQGLIGYLPQEFGMYENMTSWDYLQYLAKLKKIWNKKVRDERVKYVLEAVNMYEHKDEKIGAFSGGMKQRIGIAQILLHLPRILVVDEPTAGLDPRERIRFRNLLVELSRDRIVIFSTHIIEDISSSCNQVAVVQKGELKYFGTPIEMNSIAKDKVWQFTVPVEDFAEYEKKLTVVHHMKDGDSIRLRCISNDCPHPDATLENPVLEDAYLCLLKGLNKVEKGGKHE